MRPNYCKILSKLLYGLLFCHSISILGQNSDTGPTDTSLQKQFAFNSLTVEDGLSQNSVVSIAQDSTGYMWFATQDGLNRYDGKDFTYFNKQFELEKKGVNTKLGQVYVDAQGGIWIITNSGNLEYFNQKAENFKKIEGIPSASIITQDREKTIYIGTIGDGIYKMNPQIKALSQILKQEDLPLDIYHILASWDTLYASTSKGVLSYTGSSYKFLRNEEPGPVHINVMAKNSNNQLFLGGGQNGLFIKQPQENTFQRFPGFEAQPFPSPLDIVDLLVDSKERLWVATWETGVYLVDFDNQQVHHFDRQPNNSFSIQDNDVISLFEDNTGTIWLGTSGNGVNYYDEHLIKFNLLNNNLVPDGVSMDMIRSIEAQNGMVFLGSSGNGLTILNPRTHRHKTLSINNSQLASNYPISLYYHDNTLWIGHAGESLQAMDINETFITYPETMGMEIQKIVSHDNNILWLSTRNNGLVQFAKSKGITAQFNSDNSALTTNNIRTTEPGNNALWIGTENDGLFVLNLEKNSITKIIAVPHKIKSLYFDGILLWVGTNGNGLKSYHPTNGTVQTFSEDLLPNNVIYSILPDHHGNLWLSSNRGITKFSLKDGRPKTENYRNYDGLQSSEFNTGAYFKDAIGTLYFGGLKGLNWFNPSQITYNQAKPKTVITGVKVFNKDRAIEENQRLKHTENTLTFNFASLHFSQPDRNQFQYRLLGNDTEWIASGNNNVAHYTNLPPDDYEFQVISSNYDGVWNNVPATYSFTILKPWYATTLAIISYALCLLLLSYYFYRYLKWRWQVKNQLRLEHEETERLKKLDELKTKLYANISHEFRTPLTLISGPVENQLNKPNLTENDKKELNLVKQNANRLQGLIDQMMELSLLDSGQKKLKVAQGDLNVLLWQMIEAFQYRARQKKITIESTVQALHDGWFDKDVIEKVVSNLLSNAVKHAPENSDILFNAGEKEGMLNLAVINETGNLQTTNLSRLFQRFYQDKETTEGVGIGLALVKELVILAKGRVMVNTVEENKIQFTVNLPLDKAAFDEADLCAESSLETQKTKVKNPSEHKPVLLVVEDQPDMREFISSNFSTAYQILEAENGKEGIAQAQKHLPELIISDVMMPVKNGFELCDALKQNVLTSHIPLILLTAKVGEENEIQGFKTGADAYITKPFGIEKLKTRVRQLITAQKRLAKHYQNSFSINPELAPSSTESDFLKQLKETLDQHITNPEFTTERFSEHMLMSRTQLYRKLKAVFGMTTTEFIRWQRLKLAKKLFQESDVTVAEIAYQVGFSTPSYFIKCFKETYGKTPGEFGG